jgi:microcystin degradation protein MlrC
MQPKMTRKVQIAKKMIRRRTTVSLSLNRILLYSKDTERDPMLNLLRKLKMISRTLTKKLQLSVGSKSPTLVLLYQPSGTSLKTR